MSIKMLAVKLLLPVLLAFLFYASSLSAHCSEPFEPDHSSGWDMNVSPEYNRAELKSTDEYLSGGGTDDWKAEHDVDGDMYGVSISATPPIWGKRITLDFAYLTGDLSGSFKTREIAPTPGTTYYGKVEFDRDEWELGANIYILNAVYARVGYSTFEMDGDWVYNDGSPNEPQEYEFDAYSVGVGFRQYYHLDEQNTDFKRNIGLLVNLFLGLSTIDYKHTEKLTGASVETDDTGIEMSAEILGTYKVNIVGDSRIFAGVGYAYKENEESNLNLTEKGFTARLGIEIDF